MIKTIKQTWQKHSHKKSAWVILAVCLIMLLLAMLRIWASLMLKWQTEAQAIPPVNIVHAKKAARADAIILPGTLNAWHEAPIYARTKGYIKEWLVDIGYRVNPGDVLAIIETPELDAQLRQAEADLKVAIANNKFAQTTATRWQNLLKTDSVSKQETDEKVDTAEATAASVAAARASRDHLQELVDFEKVVAPFKGIISDRTTDNGKLINIGSDPSQAEPLFRIVQIDPLRLYVQIPQTYASRIKPNMGVTLTFVEHPAQQFKARLLETAHAINPITRTLEAEFVVENKTGILLPGSYTEVHFLIPSYPEAVNLPVSTLIFRKEGLQVAILDKNHRAILKNITVYRDFGDSVEITSGISPDEDVIINPPDSIFTHEKFRPVKEASPPTIGDKKSVA